MATAGMKQASFAPARSWLPSKWETDKLSKYHCPTSNTVVFCSEERGVRENGLGPPFQYLKHLPLFSSSEKDCLSSHLVPWLRSKFRTFVPSQHLMLQTGLK